MGTLLNIMEWKMSVCFLLLGLAAGVLPQDTIVQTAVGCEGENVLVHCENGKTIDVVDATYGYPCKGCSTKRAHKIVRGMCQELKTCVIYASNEVFGDPCYGVHKYFTVRFKCT